MTFTETCEALFSRGRFGIRPGLATIREILDRLDNPERKFPVIHVAGTNGKGSTAAFLAAILRQGGYRTALFTSPHLINYTERFKINDTEITEESLVTLARQVLAVAPQHATFFEITTAIALLYFAQEQVDIAVLEVGLGGRLDATNIMPGILSIITPVSFDHCRILGTTLQEIASEKAGIISRGSPVVCGSQPEEVLPIITARCQMSNAALYRYGHEFHAEFRQGSLLSYNGMNVSLSGITPGIPGDYQQDNAACALAAAELLSSDCGFKLKSSSLAFGIESASWPGRMEFFSGPPRILLDGAHNPAGVAALSASLERVKRDRLILVIGVMADKDFSGIITPLLSLAAKIVTVSIGLPQALPAEDLTAFCVAHGAVAASAGSVHEALSIASNQTCNDDLILVAGSLYLVGEVRGILTGKQSRPFQG